MACIAPWRTATDRCATGLKPQGTSAPCLLARSSQQSHDIDDAAIVPIRTGSRLSPEDNQTPTGHRSLHTPLQPEQRCPRWTSPTPGAHQRPARPGPAGPDRAQEAQIGPALQPPLSAPGDADRAGLEAADLCSPRLSQPSFSAPPPPAPAAPKPLDGALLPLRR
nr:predicted GPI-anchored protein 58 [Lolium perenne]